MRRITIGLALLAVALSACEMRAEIRVNDDGSGTLGFVMAMDKLLLSQLPQDEDIFEGFRNQMASESVPWRFEEFTEPGLEGLRASVPFGSLEELRTLLGSLEQSPSGDIFELDKTPDGGWRLNATGGAPSIPSLPDSPSFGDDAFGDPFAGEYPFGADADADPFGSQSPLEGIEQLFSFEFRVTLPGEPVGTDATKTVRDGGRTTFVWRMDPTAAERVSMRAETKPVAAGLPLVPIGIVVLAIGVGVMLWVRRMTPGGPPPIVFETMVPPVEYVAAELHERDLPEATERAG